MAGPWEKYQGSDASDGPWKKYATPVEEKPDKYREAAIAERDKLKAAGVDTGAGLTRRAVQGASFGFGDEIMAAASTPLEMIRQGTFDPREGYNYAKARENLILEDARKNTGIAGDVAEGIGGAATGGTLAKGGVTLAGKGSTLLGKMGYGAAEGAGYGAAYGAGEGEGLTGRATEAAKGAALGGVIGGAFPLATEGVSSAYQAYLNSRAGQEAARKAGVSPDVLRMLGNTMEGDGTLGPQGAANMARAGKDAMLADAGPNARAVLDTAIQRGGPGAVEARQAIADRTTRGAQDLTTVLDDTLGVPQGVDTARAAIRTGSSQARSAAYDAAYASPIDYSSKPGIALEELVKTRVPASAIRDANNLMRLEGNQSNQILAKLDDAGGVTFERMPDVRQLDYIKRALDQAASSGEGQGALGAQTPLGAAYQNLSRQLRDSLKEAVPAYAEALKTAADPIGRSKAVELGSKMLSPSMPRDRVAMALSGMTDREKDAVAQGVRSRIDDVMSNVTRTVQDGDVPAREAIKALKDLSSRSAREKVAMALGDAKASKLFDEVDRVATSFDLRASIADNSKTFARLATSQKIDELTSAGPIGRVAQGEPVKAGKRVVQLLTGQTPEKTARRQDQLYSDLARLLTRDTSQSMPVFNAMRGLQRNDKTNELAALLMNSRANRLLPAFVGQSANQGRTELP